MQTLEHRDALRFGNARERGQGGLGGGDGPLGIFLVGQDDMADDFLGGRIDQREALGAVRLDEGTVDVDVVDNSGLVELEAVLAVARHRGFRPAAVELGMSTSALSSAVAGLEARLPAGLRVFIDLIRELQIQ